MTVELNLPQVANVHLTLVLMGDIGAEFFKPTQMLRITALDAKGEVIAKVDCIADYDLRKIAAEWTPTLDWQRYPEGEAKPEPYTPTF
jgi:hypothetical protein